MNELMDFKGNDVEILNLNERVLFNPYDVGACLDLSKSAVRDAVSKMHKKQVVKLKNPNVEDIDIRKLNNAGENFLTESGVYKLIFRSNKPEAEAFADWVTDEVLPQIRKTGSYEIDGPTKDNKIQETTDLNGASQLASHLKEVMDEASVPSDQKLSMFLSFLGKCGLGIDVEGEGLTVDSKEKSNPHGLYTMDDIVEELSIPTLNKGQAKKALRGEIYTSKQPYRPYSNAVKDGLFVEMFEDGEKYWLITKSGREAILWFLINSPVLSDREYPVLVNDLKKVREKYDLPVPKSYG